jgi:transcriptional regulator with XRE-family HTH domain
MEIIDSIGDRLRKVREDMDLSQSEFAAIAEKAGAKGATRQSQANYEKGKRMPDAAYLAAIAAAGADVAYILTGVRTGEASAPPAPDLTPREAALLDNYRGCDEEGKRATEAVVLIGKKAQHTEVSEKLKRKRA